MAGLDRSLIAGVPLFAGLAPEALDEVLREATSVRYPKGKDVFTQEEEAHSFFVLLHGNLRVMKLTPDGQQVVVRFVSAGEIFGVAMQSGAPAIRERRRRSSTASLWSGLPLPGRGWSPAIPRSR